MSAAGCACLQREKYLRPGRRRGRSCMFLRISVLRLRCTFRPGCLDSDIMNGHFRESSEQTEILCNDSLKTRKLYTTSFYYFWMGGWLKCINGDDSFNFTCRIIIWKQYLKNYKQTTITWVQLFTISELGEIIFWWVSRHSKIGWHKLKVLSSMHTTTLFW